MDNLNNILDKFGTFIAWIPTVIVLLCILIQVILGLFRGLRKNSLLMMISVVALILAYIVFLTILVKLFFENFVLGIYKSVKGESLQTTLDVSEDNTRFSTIISAYVGGKINGDNAITYTYFSTYVEALSTSILGLVYMIFTVIIWKLFYIILHLFVYLPFLREGKYKKKKIKDYEYQVALDSVENSSDGLDETEKPKNKNAKPYKRRRLLGGAVGLVRGFLIGALSISIFGTLFYIASGMDTRGVEDGETIVVSYKGNSYDLTELYKFYDEYDSTGLNHMFNSVTNTRGVPVYVSISSLFCKGTVKVSDDGGKVTIYPIEELGHLMGIMNDGVRLLESYGVLANDSDSYEALKTLVKTNDDFVDDLYEYISSIGTTRLHRALGRTITNHFYDIVTNAGYDNKYLDVIFTGDHAINLDDLVAKSDIKVLINLIGDGLNTKDAYDENNKDVKELLINSVDSVWDVVDDLLELKIFKVLKENVNYIVGDLLEVACEKVKSLQGISFDGIIFVGDNNETSRFAKAFRKLLDSEIVSYRESNIYFNYNNINSIFNAPEGETSVIDDIKSSEALRRICSKIIVDATVDGEELFIPSSCLDSDGYISQREFEGFFDAIKGIVESTTFSHDEVLISDLADDIIPEIVDSISSNDGLPSYVVSSGILSAIASNYIYNNLGDSLTIPEELSLADDVRDTNINAWLGEDGELYHLLNAVIVFDLGNVITDSGDISIDSLLDKEKVRVAVNSKIVHYTASSKILEEALTNTEISIPSISIDENGVILKDEIINLIGAIEALEVDFDEISVDTIDANELLTSNIDVDAVLESSIIWYSISCKFDDTEIVVPNASYVDSTAEEKYISKEEIKNTIDALKSLNEVDFDNIEIDSTQFLSLYDDMSKIDTILSSYIAWQEVSKEFKNAIADANIPADVKIEVYGDDYITKEEIKAITLAMHEFGETSLSAYNVSDSILLNVNNIDTILSSHVIWYKVTNIIVDSLKFTILDDAMDLSIGDDAYMKYTEVYNMIYVCKGLGLTSFESTNISPTAIEANNLTDAVGDTITLRATITNAILYTNEHGTINLNNSISGGYGLYNSTNTAYVYSVAETKAIVRGLAKLGITNYTDDFTFSIASVTSLSAEDREVVLDSYTLWLYVSDLYNSYPHTMETENYSIYDCTAGTVVLTQNYEVIAKNELINYGL